jgi:hypothetical protein
MNLYAAGNLFIYGSLVWLHERGGKVILHNGQTEANLIWKLKLFNSDNFSKNTVTRDLLALKMK